jgi:hypothetical protein
LKVKARILQLGVCDSDSSDLSNEDEQEATDELSGSEVLQF